MQQMSNIIGNVANYYVGMTKIDKLSDFHIDSEVIRLVPEYIAKKYTILPIRKEESTLIIAISKSLDFFAIDDLKAVTGLDIRLVLAKDKDIRSAIEKYYAESDKHTSKKKTNYAILEEDVSRGIKESAPAVELVNLLLNQAVEKNISDIHIEPYKNNARIRARIDGRLIKLMAVPKNLFFEVISRLKVMAKMDITDRRTPQDGRIVVKSRKSKINLRVSTLPTINGEKVVLRILNHNEKLLDFNNLGFSSMQKEQIRNMFVKNHGMILAVGPANSGKTTTLNSILKLLNDTELNIITLEDPVEWEIPGINQVQINPKAGITFAKGLRSILRQDPDIIMVGEIRDGETADIAVRAALTGHLVFSTLHTNDALGAVTRLLEMNIEPYLLSSCLEGIIAQRLVRKICLHCRQSYENPQIVQAFLGENLPLYKGIGCSYCNNTGFKGRTVLGEVVNITGPHRKLIAKGGPLDDFSRVSQKYGFVNIKQMAISLLKDGITTIEETMGAMV